MVKSVPCQLPQPDGDSTIASSAGHDSQPRIPATASDIATVSPPAVSPEVSVPVEPIRTTQPTDPISPPSKRPRIFLDVCCGHRGPLSSAAHKLQADVAQFDILIRSEDDLLNDQAFSKLMKLAASGMIAYCACSPACCHYSRLKLRPGGPPALRTPQYLDGVPGLSGQELQKVQESNLMLERCIQLLHAVIASGGHGHLEQPSSAMSWEEPIVRAFIKLHACSCIFVSACGYGRDWHKNWMFATTFSALRSIGFKCNHPQGTHQSLQGTRTESGHFLSRETAEYPSDLCQAIAKIILPLLSTNGFTLNVDSAMSLIPSKDYHSAPFARQDGAGYASQGDWSSPHSFADVFHSLRKNFFDKIVAQRLDKQIIAAFAKHDESPPFSHEQLQPFRVLVDEFLQAQGIYPDWSVPAGQQISLHALAQFSQCMGDPDKAIFPYLISGVPIGSDTPIVPSQCFPLQPTPDDYQPPLLTVHHTNWASAEDEPEIVQDLIDKEIAAGWVQCFDGTIDEAREFFPHGLAVGKLGLALSDTRPPRLVLDSTVCGVNPQCVMPERTTLPTIKDVVRSYPLRGRPCDLAGVSFDVRSAHKQVAVNKKYHGHLCFQHRSKLYYYTVCPFGAVFSAHFWARLGGVFLRLFHRFCWLAHSGFLYVDDMLMIQDNQVLPISTAAIAILCLLFGLPISWKKCEFGPTITWIGWQIHIYCGFVCIPSLKRNKLLDLLRRLTSSNHGSKKVLEQFLGLALWITQLWPHMRTWLHFLYRDLHSIPASQYSVDPGSWEEVCNSVSDDLRFHHQPRFSAIPLNGHLIQVRHKTVQTKADLQTCLLSDKRIWLRIRDPNSTKRKISSDSHRILKMYITWVESISPIVSMWPKPMWHGICVADAFAHGTTCGIGGFVQFSPNDTKWFSLRLDATDFMTLRIPMHEDLQKDISSLETLAQIALVFLVVKHLPGFRIPLKIATWSDNTAAESVSNKLFSTQMPLALFLERLSLLISSSTIEVDISHIAGKSNDLADALSRWDQQNDPPPPFHINDRFHLSLQDLWHQAPSATLHPSDAWIPWSIP